VTRSFLITREIAGALEGHTYAAQLRGLERSRFLRRVAELARRFHEAGFVHKDFYLGHVLVAPGTGAPALFLIDLQRVVKPCCFRTRWVTKDLGALAYSALKAGVTRAELLRSYLTYGAHPELGAAEKRAARRILRRVVRLRRHRPKHG
jgi:heptose I phosphotransferase